MLRHANCLGFGLSAYVFTRDLVRQRCIINSLQYGALGLNDVVTYHPQVPLEGWTESGISTERGLENTEALFKDKICQHQVVRIDRNERGIRSQN